MELFVLFAPYSIHIMITFYAVIPVHALISAWLGTILRYFNDNIACRYGSDNYSQW